MWLVHTQKKFNCYPENLSWIKNKVFDIVVKVTEAEGKVDPPFQKNLGRVSPYI